MTDEAAAAIRRMVDRETDAWNRKDGDALVALLHPDMVWPWPESERGHDPLTWTTGMGWFNADRWRAAWQSLFDQNDLVSNERRSLRVEVTLEGDGGFAVVDIDTRWRAFQSGAEDRWFGRVRKVDAYCNDGWKMTMHTGILRYD